MTFIISLIVIVTFEVTWFTERKKLHILFTVWWLKEKSDTSSHDIITGTGIVLLTK
jgi:hypothetical protein